jgi:hypothetical protein
MIRTRGGRTAAAALVFAAVSLAPPGAAAGTVTFSVDPPTLLSYLRAVTPYELAIGKAGLSESLTLSNPRDLRIEAGKILMKVDVRGTPLPVEDVLEPRLTIRWNETRKAWEAKVENVQLRVPMFGTVDLSEHMRPIAIPSTFTQPAEAGTEALLVDGKILSLKVLDTSIQVSADLAFRRDPAARRTAPQQPRDPNSTAAPNSGQ